MFVNRLLLNEASCEVTLDKYRSVLFEELKESEEFPFGLQCELKRRVHTRNGDTVPVKLAYDVHSLMSVIEGEITRTGKTCYDQIIAKRLVNVSAHSQHLVLITQL